MLLVSLSLTMTCSHWCALWFAARATQEVRRLKKTIERMMVAKPGGKPGPARLAAAAAGSVTSVYS